MVTFIHAADIHLGRSPSFSAHKIDIVYKALMNLASEAIEKKVDFVCLVGDIFDSRNVDISDRLRFLNFARKLSHYNIPIYIVFGNHDPLDRRLKNLENQAENIKIFSSKSVEVVEEANYRIAGISYWQKDVNQSLVPYFEKMSKSTLPTIAMMHAELKGAKSENYHENYAACTTDELKKCIHVDYWALGHIHMRQIVSSNTPAIVYPGSLQAVRINEEGAHGAVLVKWIAANEIPEITFLDLAEVTVKSVNIDISDCRLLDDVYMNLHKVLNPYDDDVFVKVSLVGRINSTLKKSIMTNFDPSKVAEAVNLDERAFLVGDDTTVKIDFDNIRGESSIRGMFLEKAESISPDSLIKNLQKIFPHEITSFIEEKNLLSMVHKAAIELGIAALSGEDIIK